MNEINSPNLGGYLKSHFALIANIKNDMDIDIIRNDFPIGCRHNEITFRTKWIIHLAPPANPDIARSFLEKDALPLSYGGIIT
jgi:hypothetical protein